MGHHKKLRAGRKEEKLTRFSRGWKNTEQQRTAEVGKAAGRWGQNSLSDGLLAFFCCEAERPVRTEGLGTKRNEINPKGRGLENFFWDKQEGKRLKRPVMTERFKSGTGHRDSANAL